MASADKQVDLIGKRADWCRLPEPIRQKIKGPGIELLIRLRESIAKDAGIPMPPICVEPWGWMHENGSVIYGRATPVRRKDSFCWGVEMPGSNLVIIDNSNNSKILRRILVHEFSHCFWWISRIINAEQSGKVTINDAEIEANDDQMLERVKARDTVEHVDPSDWFSQADAQEFMWYDSPEHGTDELHPFSLAFYENWSGKGLPTKFPNLRFEVTGTLGIPQELIERVRKGSPTR